ncbi:alpha/beta fold hydrolase [Candidatus Mycoplasma pogonae]
MELQRYAVNIQNCEQFQHQVINAKGNILFLHGFTSKYQFHIDTLKDLFSAYNIYAINVPGHGKSSFTATSELNMLHYANVYAQYIEQLQLKDIILYGYSMGGGIAVLLNAILPKGIVKKIILVNPANKAILENTQHIKKMLPNNIDDVKDVLKSMYANYLKHFGTEAKFEQLAIDVYNDLTTNQKHLIAMVDVDLMTRTMHLLQSLISQITVPTLLIVGEQDRLVIAKHTIANFSHNDNINIAVIANAGHNPIIENRDDFVKAIKAFVK